MSKRNKNNNPNRIVICYASRAMFKQLGMLGNSMKRVDAVELLMKKLGLQPTKLGKKEATEWLLDWYKSGRETGSIPSTKSAKTKSVRRKESYSDYLAGDLWNAIRRFVLLESRYLCKGCCGLANQVHHTSYDNMTMRGRDTSKLVALCGDCHQHIEFNDDGSKATLDQANARLLSLMASNKVIRTAPQSKTEEIIDSWREQANQ